MKWLYRAALLAFLVRIDSTLTEIVHRLIVLRELAEHPAVQVRHLHLPDDTGFTIPGYKDLTHSKFGGALKRHEASFNVSPSETTPTTTTTGPTAATGRSAETSGETGEGSVLPLIPKTHPEYSKTSWPGPDSEQEAGSPGAAPASSASGPEHDHVAAVACRYSCPAYFRVQREKIAASGHAVICIPSLAYPHRDCDLHPHVAGEAL